MPVYSYLDVSTAHVTEPEMGAIALNFPDLDDSGPRVIAHHYGCWVWVTEDDLDERFPGLREHYPNVAACMVRAQELGCNWINFDRDAGYEVEAGLPTFDW